MNGFIGSNPISTTNRRMTKNLSPPETLIGTGSKEPGKDTMALNLDFSAVPSRDPLEEGVYLLQIAEAAEKESSTGNPMIAVTYDVVATQSGETVEGNRKLWDNYSLQAQALFKLKELLSALDIDTSEIVSLEIDELIGQQVLAKVVQETYNGELRNRVKKIYPVG